MITLSWNQPVRLVPKSGDLGIPEIVLLLCEERVWPHVDILDVEYVTPAPNGCSGESYDIAKVPDTLIFPFGDKPPLFTVVKRDPEARTIDIELSEFVEIKE